MIEKAIKYRRIIILVTFYLVKYRVLTLLLSNRRLLNRLQAHQTAEVESEISYRQVQPKQRIIRLTDVIIRKLMPDTSCLVRTAVQKELLKRHGMSTSVFVGVKRENDRIIAHAWLQDDRDPGYQKLLQLS